MQTLREIREMLTEAALTPKRRLGQCFMIDKNLIGKLLELADLNGDETVLEVGPGTGSLTEELLKQAKRVVGVEVDRGLVELLQRRLGDRSALTLICGDVLVSKRRISSEVLEALQGGCDMVSNLPYSIATPLVAECLVSSWKAVTGDTSAPLFRRLTFTVQREVADRMTAPPHSESYGPVSVLVTLLGRVVETWAVPASAFWPKPKVASRMLRIDFDESAARLLGSVEMLTTMLSLAFGQRRKQIGAIARKSSKRLPAGALADVLEATQVDLRARAEQIAPQQFLELANALAARS